MCRLLVWPLFACIASVVQAEDSRDTYPHRSECPENGVQYRDARTPDSFSNFVRCQCTSYVAHKLSQLFAARNKPSTFAQKFHNTAYYMPQARKWTEGDLNGQSVNRWSNAMYWYNSARFAGIGVTGATDNFTWDTGSYNAVFKGDVAYWKQKSGYPVGHVAYVEAVGQDVAGKGVAWVTISEYNYVTPPGYEYSYRTLYKGDPKFPDYFLHIDQDHAYCAAHPTVDNCVALNGGQMIASTGSKADGLGGSSTPFNLTVNRFWVRDAATSTDLNPETTLVRTGQVLQPRIQVKAKDGDTHDHMRPGKDRIEIDLYARLDSGDWFFLKREYIQATNLPSGSTHTEHVDYTVPPGIQTLSFKAKIDAEDEASESNEGDNWTEIQTFSVVSPIPTSPTSLTITVTD